jgi:hypothetical protein
MVYVYVGTLNLHWPPSTSRSPSLPSSPQPGASNQNACSSAADSSEFHVAIHTLPLQNRFVIDCLGSPSVSFKLCVDGDPYNLFLLLSSGLAKGFLRITGSFEGSCLSNLQRQDSSPDVWIGHPRIETPGETLRLVVEITDELILESSRRSLETRTGCLSPFSFGIMSHFFPSQILRHDPLDVNELLSMCLPTCYPLTESGLNLQPQNLSPTLLQFQRRAVSWMLWREHFTEPALIQDPSETSLKTDRGNSLVYNSFTGEIDALIDTKPAILTVRLFQSVEKLRGGILAEEMGLGKTVETLALMLLNPMRNSGLESHAGGLPYGKATVIITPSAILTQWISEIEKHAPSLK